MLKMKKKKNPLQKRKLLEAQKKIFIDTVKI